jgi:hypothetical protein
MKNKTDDSIGQWFPYSCEQRLTGTLHCPSDTSRRDMEMQLDHLKDNSEPETGVGVSYEEWKTKKSHFIRRVKVKLSL